MRGILKDRLEAKIERIPESGCWIWMGSSRGGYGLIKKNKKSIGTHRAAWESYKGTIPNGMCILHRCDTSLCCNPSHLFVGTQLDNIHDRDIKGRRRHNPIRGENHCCSKLTELKVADILKDKRMHKEICLDYGVSRQTVGDIKTGRTWRKVKSLIVNEPEVRQPGEN